MAEISRVEAMIIAIRKALDLAERELDPGTEAHRAVNFAIGMTERGEPGGHEYNILTALDALAAEICGTSVRKLFIDGQESPTAVTAGTAFFMVSVALNLARRAGRDPASIPVTFELTELDLAFGPLKHPEPQDGP